MKQKNRKYNILFISPHYNYFVPNNSSFHRMYQNLIFLHNNANFNVIVLQPSRERKMENHDLKKNINCYYYKELSFLGNLFQIFNDFNPFFIVDVIKILKKHCIDLIHVDFLFGISILKLITKTPISYNTHNIEYIYAEQIGKNYNKIPKFLRELYLKFIYFLERLAIKSVANINAISYIDKKKFIKIYSIPSEKIIVNYMGYIKNIYNNPIEQKFARDELKVDKNKFIIIFHDSYSNKEDINILRYKIAPRIKDNDILFLIAGKMPRFEDTENLKFLGFLSDLKKYLYCADVGIAINLKGSGIRIKILDYLSACIPIISTKKGAEGHLIENGKHGYIINNVEEITNKILELKNNPMKVKQFKSNIRELLNKKYNIKENLKIVEKKYLEILRRFQN